jgi:Secretion system C-terminal sorting domain
MKKNVLGILAIFSASFSFSQTFTQANEPIVGETKLLYVCDSFATNYANVTGSGVTWNYGTIAGYPGVTKNITVENPSSTPYATDFPNSTAATHIDDFTYTFLTTSATSRASQGYVLENTDLGVVKAIFGTNEQQLMAYPVSMPTMLNDSFTGTLNFTYGGIPQNPSLAGYSHASFDGIGTLIQPNGVSLTNISRFHIQDTATTSLPIIGTCMVIRSQFEYYDLSSTAHLPVFLHLSAKVVSGFPEPLIDQSVVLSQVASTSSNSIEEIKKNNLVVYPNPATNQVKIQGISSESKVSLVDVSGREIVLNKLQDNAYDLSEITAGLYILQVTTGQVIQTQTLVIE